MSTDRLVSTVPPRCHRQPARVLARAFMDDPVSQSIFLRLSPPRRLHNLTVEFTVEMEVCTRRGWPLQVMQAGSLVAAAVIYPPGTYPPPWLDQRRIDLGFLWGHYPYDLRTATRWESAVAQEHPPHVLRPQFYLEYLGVLPACQGQGFGSAILRTLTARADREQAGCCLETATPRNLPLYTRFGFQVETERLILGMPIWFMHRPPGSAVPAHHRS